MNSTRYYFVLHKHRILFSSFNTDLLGPSTLATLFSHRWPRFCGGDIYSRRKALFSSFGEHTAVCGSSVRQAVARPRHRQSVCIHNIHVALVCSGPPQKRGHLWLNKVASVLGPFVRVNRFGVGCWYKFPFLKCLIYNLFCLN